MTDAELKAHNAQQARTIKRLETELAEQKCWNAQSARNAKKAWVELAQVKRQYAKERGRVAPLQGMVEWLQARVAELEDPKRQAEGYFKDGE